MTENTNDNNGTDHSKIMKITDLKEIDEHLGIASESLNKAFYKIMDYSKGQTKVQKLYYIRTLRAGINIIEMRIKSINTSLEDWEKSDGKKKSTED
ncbi:MAG: hypothetical protein GY714_13215 [Desulfobacterales bacterium]|nr:hypothetical protein [Desulfobacterales bacterium]